MVEKLEKEEPLQVQSFYACSSLFASLKMKKEEILVIKKKHSKYEFDRLGT